MAASDRVFDFREYDEDYDAVECTTYGSNWTFLCDPDDDSEIYMGSIVIAVDGACRNNGRPNAEAAAGVLFHPGNARWNEAVTFDQDCITSQRAELAAASRALKAAIKIRKVNPKNPNAQTTFTEGPFRHLARVVIKTDSAYLFGGMTEWVYKWNDNGYINCRGLPVVNGDLFRRLDDLVDELNDMDVRVLFWQVPRTKNWKADRLANAALDGLTAQEAVEQYEL